MTPEAARFLTGAAKDRQRLVCSAYTAALMVLVARNWDLLIRTYEGPGK